MSFGVRIYISEVAYKDGLQLISGTTFGGEKIVRAVRAQGHGISTHPPVGSIGYVSFLFGKRDMPVLHGIEHPDKTPTDMQDGNATLYDHNGNKLALKDDAATLSHATKTYLSAAGCSIDISGGKIVIG